MYKNIEEWTIEDLISYLQRMKGADSVKRKWLWKHSDDLLWSWTMRYANDKYLGQRFYSKKAKEIMEMTSPKKWSKQLIHEHIVPRHVLKQLFEDLVDLNVLINEDSVRAFLNKYCIAAVITVAEDSLLEKDLRQSMPADWDKVDAWARYKKVGLQSEIVEYSHDDIIKSLEPMNKLKLDKKPSKKTVKKTKFAEVRQNILQTLGDKQLLVSDEGNHLIVSVNGEEKRAALETRLWIRAFHMNKDVQLIFSVNDDIYFLPHDQAVEIVKIAAPRTFDSNSWRYAGGYNWNGFSKALEAGFAKYKIN